MEDILDQELVFLNDFEYDEAAKKWMAWSFFKRFLEGGELTVAGPKNRGGNAIFKSDAPVIMTAPQEVQLWRGKHLDISEVEQMRNRIKYINLSYQFTEEERREVDPCGHCGARFYLEGLTASAALPQDGAHKSVKGESAVSVPPFGSSRR